MSDYFDKLEIMAAKERKSYFTRKMKEHDPARL